MTADDAGVGALPRTGTTVSRHARARRRLNWLLTIPAAGARCKASTMAEKILLARRPVLMLPDRAHPFARCDRPGRPRPRSAGVRGNVASRLALWLIFLVDKSFEEGVACQAGGKTIMRSMFGLLLASAILAFRSSAIAAPGDPFGGDDAGCIPPTAAVGRCEDGVQKALTKYIQTVIKCHIKAADAAVKSMPFDEELCESNPSRSTTRRSRSSRSPAAGSARSSMRRGCGRRSRRFSTTATGLSTAVRERPSAGMTPATCRPIPSPRSARTGWRRRIRSTSRRSPSATSRPRTRA